MFDSKFKSDVNENVEVLRADLEDVKNSLAALTEILSHNGDIFHELMEQVYAVKKYVDETADSDLIVCDDMSEDGFEIHTNDDETIPRITPTPISLRSIFSKQRYDEFVALPGLSQHTRTKIKYPIRALNEFVKANGVYTLNEGVAGLFIQKMFRNYKDSTAKGYLSQLDLYLDYLEDMGDGINVLKNPLKDAGLKYHRCSADEWL